MKDFKKERKYEFDLETDKYTNSTNLSNSEIESPSKRTSNIEDHHYANSFSISQKESNKENLDDEHNYYDIPTVLNFS